jgi:prepilin peptidase CpaA
MAFGAATDLLTMTIPNRLSIALCAAFFVLAPVAGLGWHDILSNMGAGAALLLVGIFLFSLGWLGGGDAKILAAAALWLGFDHLVMFLAYTAAFGGALAMAILAYRSMPASALPLPGPSSYTRRPIGMRPSPAERAAVTGSPAVSLASICNAG